MTAKELKIEIDKALELLKLSEDSTIVAVDMNGDLYDICGIEVEDCKLYLSLDNM